MTLGSQTRVNNSDPRKVAQTGIEEIFRRPNQLAFLLGIV